MEDFLYRPIVGVMCGGGSKVAEYEPLAKELGALIASTGWNVLTGGGSGLMATVTSSFNAVPGRQGKSIGMLPHEGKNKAGSDVGILTGLKGTVWVDGYLAGDSRNHLNARLSDVIVALPGGGGTQSELTLSVRRKKPCIAFLGKGGRIGSLQETSDGKIKVDDTLVPIATGIGEVDGWLKSQDLPTIQLVNKA